MEEDLLAEGSSYRGWKAKQRAGSETLKHIWAKCSERGGTCVLCPETQPPVLAGEVGEEIGVMRPLGVGVALVTMG